MRELLFSYLGILIHYTLGVDRTPLILRKGPFQCELDSGISNYPLIDLVSLSYTFPGPLPRRSTNFMSFVGHTDVFSLTPPVTLRSTFLSKSSV